MINITNLSQNASTEQSAMDAITGGCYIRRPKGMTSRRYSWLVKKGKLGGCFHRRVVCRPHYPRFKRSLFV